MAETVFAVTQTRPHEPIRRLRLDRITLQTHGLIVPCRPNADAIELLSNGPPVVGCNVSILKDGIFVGEDIIGEVCIAAPWLFSGYHKNEDATEQAFNGPWFRSGDLGFLHQGEVFLVGRLKDIIIVNGKNIVAHDVEAAVARVPYVRPGRAVAFGHYVDALGTEQLVVVAERLDDVTDDLTVVSLLNHAVSEEVGVGCGDVRLVEPGWLIKTTSGKISRSENARRYVDRFLRSTSVKPTTQSRGSSR
jgi:acyl-CoA synthetase (AMP-forming)/AMP-acid ligase II